MYANKTSFRLTPITAVILIKTVMIVYKIQMSVHLAQMATFLMIVETAVISVLLINAMNVILMKVTISFALTVLQTTNLIITTNAVIKNFTTFVIPALLKEIIAILV